MKSPDLYLREYHAVQRYRRRPAQTRRALRQLGQLHHGQLAIIEDGERQTFGRAGSVLHGGNPGTGSGRLGASRQQRLRSVPARPTSTATGPRRT